MKRLRVAEKIKRDYKYYVLFFDDEVINNRDFNKRIKEFSIENKGVNLIINLINLTELKEYRGKSIFKIPNNKNYSLEVLGTRFINDEKTYEDLLFEFLIYDETFNWEIYVNIGYDLALFACQNEFLHKTFTSFFKPYDNFSLNEKIEEIGVLFVNAEGKSIFSNS